MKRITIEVKENGAGWSIVAKIGPKDKGLTSVQNYDSPAAATRMARSIMLAFRDRENKFNLISPAKGYWSA